MSGKRLSHEPERWQLYGGRDPRDVPSYTTYEAARYVRLPMRTVQNWAFGFGSYGGHPLIEVSDTDRHMLTFWNVAELHVLGSLRRFHQIPPRRLRETIKYLAGAFNSEHPLVVERMLTDGVSVFVEELGSLINASKSGQRAMRPLIEAHLHRIEQDADGLAVRLYPFVRHDARASPSLEALRDEPRIISIDPRIRFGRPVIVGTSIPTEEIAERFLAGDTFVELAKEYGRQPQEIEEAIRCELALDKAA